MRRRLIGAGATWAVAALVVVAAAHPEGCRTPSTVEAQAGAEAAVDWIRVNQRDDGAFLYRYDRGEARDLGQYNIVRHAGVLLSLAQAEAAGIDGADDAFRSGLDWADARIIDVGDGSALAQGQTVETGAVALLVTALVEWRDATGGTDQDDLLRGLGRFLASRVTPEGAVVATVDVDEGDIADSRSPFSTGEAAWALARLHTTFPDEGWDDPARRVLGYVATDRDDVERRFPPVSDHWSAYALAEVGVEWDEPLTGDEQELARRQAALFGLQTRYESQRRETGPVRWTRGPIALGSGVGTLGEGLGAMHRLAAGDEVAADMKDQVDERLHCVAGILVDRQVSAREAAHYEEPERVAGAWFRDDITQMDNQQHALSALLAAMADLPDRDEPGPDFVNLALAALAVLTTTPVVRGRLALGQDPSPAARAAALAMLAGLAVATVVVGPALADATDVSAPTVRIAAGFVIAVTSIPDLWRRPLVAAPTDPPWRAGLVPVAFPELFGPPLAAALTAVAVDLPLGSTVGLIVACVLAVAAVDRLPGPRTATGPLRALAGLRAATAMAVGIALVMHGVYDI